MLHLVYLYLQLYDYPNAIKTGTSLKKLFSGKLTAQNE